MATPIRIKRSAVPGKKPTIDQLQLGELAVNFYDGKLFFKQDTNGVGIGTRIVEVGAGQSIGRTLYVTSNGNDNNTGLNDLDGKATIRAALEISKSNDTIKVLPGTYIENNPINIPDNVSIEGAELRRCLVQPQNSGEDLFYVGNGAHITDLSFVGSASTNGAAVISYRPLSGVSSDRFFDAARLIRQNLDFIAEQTAGYISSSTDYTPNPTIAINDAFLSDIKGKIKKTYRSLCHDITRGGNSKCIGTGLTYTGLNLNHITALNYSAGIARAVVTNYIWSDKSEGSQIGVSTADYDGSVGILTVTTSSSHGLETDDVAEVKNITFQCDSGQTVYPKGSIGYNFPVHKKVSDDKFEIVVGLNTRTHTYVSGGTIQKQVNYQSTETQLRDLSIQGEPSGGGFNNALASCSNVVSSIYTCVGIVTGMIQNNIDGNPTITGFTTTYPGGNGVVYNGKNPNVGILTASLSPHQGVNIITKGPYIRNCTNFIPNSIGARIDGFNSDEGAEINDIGVQGSFNVDSYTQYNQGGIGVSVTNGAYCQLVSIFTICDDTAIYSGQGGQCDLTNSNSSFGTRGLVAEGNADNYSKCIDRYTGKINELAAVGQNIVKISGVGRNRPYNGQVIYFDKKYQVVSDIEITNGGSNYTSPPLVTISDPTGSGIAIPAQATAEVSGGRVSKVLLRGGGSQYESIPSVTFSGGGGAGAAATCTMESIYYTVDSATKPSSGISTVTLIQNLNNEVGIGTTVFFARQSLQIVSSHSFQYIGAGNTIETAYPSQGAVPIQENEVIKLDGGEVSYTSTDERGNFRIGDGVVIDQSTGTVSGSIYIKSLFTQVTPFILALGGD